MKHLLHVNVQLHVAFQRIVINCLGKAVIAFMLNFLYEKTLRTVVSTEDTCAKAHHYLV